MTTASGQRTIVRGACPHDCPDTCAMLVTVEDGRAISVRGDPEHPFTRGGLCVKVNNYEQRVYSSDRVLYPLKRSGPKGTSQFTRVSWDEALGVIRDRWTDIIDNFGPTAILPYSYLGTEGILNGLNVGDAFFNKLGATISERTFCDSGSCTAYFMTIGPSPGMDPESFKHSKYIILWACNTISTNLHHWPFIAEAKNNGAKLVVIDPVKTRTAREADWHIPIRPGTDAALAMGMMNVIISEDLVDHDYVKNYTEGFEELRDRVQAYSPERVAEITGISPQDIRTLAREYATTQPSVIRIGVAIERHAGGGQTVRAAACLPALVGAWRRVGGGMLAAANLGLPGQMGKSNAAGLDQARDARSKPVAAWTSAHWRRKARSAHQILVRLQLESCGCSPGTGQNHPRPRARGPFHRGQRAVPHRHGALRRHRSPCHHAAGAVRHHVLLGAFVSVAESKGDRATRRGGPQHGTVPATSPHHGLR